MGVPQCSPHVLSNTRQLIVSLSLSYPRETRNIRMNKNLNRKKYLSNIPKDNKISISILRLSVTFLFILFFLFLGVGVTALHYQFVFYIFKFVRSWTFFLNFDWSWCRQINYCNINIDTYCCFFHVPIFKFKFLGFRGIEKFVGCA